MLRYCYTVQKVLTSSPVPQPQTAWLTGQHTVTTEQYHKTLLSRSYREGYVLGGRGALSRHASLRMTILQSSLLLFGEHYPTTDSCQG